MQSELEDVPVVCIYTRCMFLYIGPYSFLHVGFRTVVEDDLLQRLREFCASHPDNLEWLSSYTEIPMRQAAKYVNDGLAIDETAVYGLALALAIVSPKR